jgi:hypothetical protein
MSSELIIHVQDKSRPLTCMKARRGNKGLALLMLNLDTRWVWVVNAKLRPLFPRRSSPLLIVQETGWASGSAWADMEKGKPLPPPGFEPQRLAVPIKLS